MLVAPRLDYAVRPGYLTAEWMWKCFNVSYTASRLYTPPWAPYREMDIKCWNVSYASP